MKSAHWLAAMMCVCAGALPVIVIAGPEAQIRAQDLQKLKVPGKISAVVWTQRGESCTLQVVLQMPVEFQIGAKVAAQRRAAGLSVGAPAAPKLPQVQAWLLRLDGALVARDPATAAFPAAVHANDGVPLEVMYSYPASAAQEAVAVAIMVDGMYYIEQLRPFGT